MVVLTVNDVGTGGRCSEAGVALHHPAARALGGGGGARRGESRSPVVVRTDVGSSSTSSCIKDDATETTPRTEQEFPRRGALRRADGVQSGGRVRLVPASVGDRTTMMSVRPVGMGSVCAGACALPCRVLVANDEYRVVRAEWRAALEKGR